VALVSGVGLGAGLMYLIDSEAGSDADADELVVRRARWRASSVLSDPHAVDIHAHQGRVVLTGLVIADEARRLLSAVASIRGVQQVEDHLERFEPDPRARRSAWPAAARLATGAAGASLALYAARRRGALGAALASLGLGLLLGSVARARP
jgi:hypothetical protein